ncbi:MAG: hypothetical protein RLZZ241_1493 [Bacteroidota bacterium]|jgi:outer membrane biosynthesis protein TonB
MNLSHNQLASLSTLLSLGILLLGLVNIRLQSSAEEEYVIALEVLEELEQIENEETELAAANNASELSHRAYNETAKPTIANPEPLKTLEELLAEQPWSETEAPEGSEAGYADQLRKLSEKRNENQQLLEAKEAEKQNYLVSPKDRQTTISYSLVDRYARDLPPPIYTCIVGGKVVVKIEVDARGFVIQARINETASTTTNGCLKDNALAYALKSRFSPSEKAQQIGTITYMFQGK